MENWIWIVIAVAFLYIMFRHGGCCGGRAGHGKHGGEEGAAGKSGHGHSGMQEKEEDPGGRRAGGCH